MLFTPSDVTSGLMQGLDLRTALTRDVFVQNDI